MFQLRVYVEIIVPNSSSIGRWERQMMDRGNGWMETGKGEGAVLVCLRGSGSSVLQGQLFRLCLSVGNHSAET